MYGAASCRCDPRAVCCVVCRGVLQGAPAARRCARLQEEDVGKARRQQPDVQRGHDILRATTHARGANSLIYSQGRDLAARHMPGGPVGPPAWWVATSNVA